MDKSPKCKSKIYRTLKKETTINLCDLGLDNSFLDRTLKAQPTKEKIN